MNEVDMNVKLNSVMAMSVPARKALKLTDIVNKLIQRLLSELPYLLLMVVIDGKLTEQEKQMIVDKVVDIVKGVLKEL